MNELKKIWSKPLSSRDVMPYITACQHLPISNTTDRYLSAATELAKHH